MSTVGNTTILLMMLSVVLSAAVAEEVISNPVEQRFRNLRKGSLTLPVETRPIHFPTHHLQGMTAVDDRFFLSSVEVIDRAAEQGVGHLHEMDRNGNLLREIQLGEGTLYHPGGIDYDGTHLWVPVAAYRPDSAAIMYAVDPETLAAREVFRFNDHLGAAAHFPDRQVLIAVSWGSRCFYRWDTRKQGEDWVVEEPDRPKCIPNGNHYIDYQDMQRIPGTPYLLCSGLQTYTDGDKRLPSLRLGGIDLVHIEELRVHHQVPVPVRPPAMPAWTQNPFYVELVEAGLRFFFIPEDDRSTLHIFEVNTVD